MIHAVRWPRPGLALLLVLALIGCGCLGLYFVAWSTCAATSADDADRLAPLASLAPDNANRLLDLTDFAFTRNLPACRQPVRLLIVLISAAQHFQNRRLIRKTWASKLVDEAGAAGLEYRMFFLLASVRDRDSATALKLQQQIDAEGLEYQDIVQANFIDHYGNLTYKHAAALQWHQLHCPHATHLLKLDDDVYLDGRHLAGATAALPRHSLLMGRRMNPGEVERKLLLPGNRLVVSGHFSWPAKRGERNRSAMGAAILYSADVVGRLYAEVQLHPDLWMADVHVIGTVRQAAGVRLTGCVGMLAPLQVKRRTWGFEWMTDLERCNGNR